MKATVQCSYLAAALLGVLITTQVQSQTYDADLAQQLTNPGADLITVPVQMNFDYDIGPFEDGSKIQTNVQPVIPFKLGPDWTQWQESAPIEVMRPEAACEGTKYPIKPSNYGSAIEVCQLRDPCIFEEAGKVYLFYTIAGEMGIALAELSIAMHAP